MLTLDADLQTTLTRLSRALIARGWRMTTAESCTGGLIAATCTDIAGSSDWFDQGWVTYSNAAKTAQLGVTAEVIAQHGAVSQPVAEAMARGACQASHQAVGVAVTGVAGPGGGSAAKPVGMVWFGWCVDGRVSSECRRFEGDRAAVRAQTVAHALTRLQTLVGD